MLSPTFLLAVSIYVIVLILRFAGNGVVSTLLQRPVTGADNEVLRAGSDLNIAGLGLFFGATGVNGVTKLTGSTPYTVYLAFFFITVLVNYVLFLCIADKKIAEVFYARNAMIMFGASLTLGFVVLAFVATLLVSAK